MKGKKKKNWIQQELELERSKKLLNKLINDILPTIERAGDFDHADVLKEVALGNDLWIAHCKKMNYNDKIHGRFLIGFGLYKKEVMRRLEEQTHVQE